MSYASFIQKNTDPNWNDGFRTAILWMTEGLEPQKQQETYSTRVLAAIHNAIRKTMHINPELIYTSSRKREITYARSMAWVIYQEITGCTQEQLAKAFRNSHNRITYVHMRNSVLSLSESYPDFKTRFETLRNAALSDLLIERVQYLDLGLPSGTLWADRNLIEQTPSSFFHNYLRDLLPDISLTEELLRECTWSWDNDKEAARATGPNGNSILLPCEGYILDGTKHMEHSYGCYAVINPDNGPQQYLLFRFIRNTQAFLTERKDNRLLSLRPVKKTSV